MVWQPGSVMRRRSFTSDIRCLDNGPPLLNFGPLKRAECLRRLLVARRDLIAKIAKSLTNGWISQAAHDGRVERSDNLFRRALGHPKSEPVRGIEAR